MTAKLSSLQRSTYLPLFQLNWGQWVYLRAKRLLDVLVAGVALFLLTPVFAAIALAIKLDSPGPVIFRQQRVRGDQPANAEHPEQNTFTFLKFRSMVRNADCSTHQKYVESLINGQAARQQNGLYKLQDRRITRIGGLLRRTSLDELPQLWNVLRGDMSLVGPRPALPYEVRVYKPWHRERLCITPGLTGLWQVAGRSKLSFDEMVGLDVTYQAKLSRAALGRIASRGTALTTALADQLDRYMRSRERDWTYLHDPLAMALTIDRSFVELRPFHVSVETKGEFTTGATVAVPPGDQPANAQVAVAVDAPRFAEFFVDRVCS